VTLPRGSSTDELVRWVQANSEFADDEVDAVVPAAIDALYTARDADRTMHEAGAAAALAVLEAQNRLFRKDAA
jgi:hypothetical protein